MQGELFLGELGQKELADALGLQRRTDTDRVAEGNLIHAPAHQIACNLERSLWIYLALVRATPDGGDVGADPQPGVTRGGDQLFEHLQGALNALVRVALIVRFARREEDGDLLQPGQFRPFQARGIGAERAEAHTWGGSE